MNLAAVLMCWNVPRISEDLLYELFCNAGPIEEISFAKNGKSCFIVYEHADAVVTAKDIFKDVKLDGRPLKMFDYDEIAKIYHQQDVQIAQNRNFMYENNPSQNFSNKSSESPHHFQDSRLYSNYNRNAPLYHRTGSEKYSEFNERNLLHNNLTSSQQPVVENELKDCRTNSMRNTSMTCYGSNNSIQSRPDLVPSTSNQSSKAREFDTNSAIHNLINGSNDSIDDLMNPYNTPVSRNSPNIPDHFSKRSSQLDHYKHDVNFPGYFMPGRHSRNVQEESDHSRVFNNSIHHGDTRHNQRNKFDPKHYSYQRDHPYRQRQPDCESYYREPKFGNFSHSGANSKSRNTYPGEQDRRHREHRKRGSRKH